MRRFQLVLAVAASTLLGSCRDLAPDGVGLYSLKTINGQALPVPVAGCCGYYRGGSITINADRTFTQELLISALPTSDTSFGYTAWGTWELSDTALSFTGQYLLTTDTAATLSGATLTRNGWVYKKQ